jgi:LysR family hydrogen peroxide-inducible transcriptional activator
MVAQRFTPESEGIQRTFEGSSLETIRHMVASGIGITVMPITAVPIAQLPRSYQTASPHAKETTDKSLQPQQLLTYIPFLEPLPKRTVALVWRRSFTRLAALDALKSAVQACDFAGVSMCPLVGTSQ